MGQVRLSNLSEDLIDTGLTSTQLFEQDISKLTPKKVKSESGFDEQPCDILLGGPPCQGFSAHRLNDAGVDDPRNELLLRYFEYVRVLRPIFFLVENVPGLLWPKHKKFLEAFYELGRRAAYGVIEPQVIMPEISACRKAGAEFSSWASTENVLTRLRHGRRRRRTRRLNPRRVYRLGLLLQ